MSNHFTANCESSIRKSLGIESESIKKIAETCDYSIIEKIIEEFVNCKGKIIISGCGTSGEAGKKITHTLNCVECSALFLSPSQALHGGLGVFSEKDIAILLSKGGKTSEIIQMLPALKERGVRIVAVTECENSYLALQSDIMLKIGKVKEADDYDMLATASTLCVIAVFDAIAIEVSKRNGFSLHNFALNHPGGAVGERLLVEI